MTKLSITEDPCAVANQGWAQATTWQCPFPPLQLGLRHDSQGPELSNTTHSAPPEEEETGKKQSVHVVSLVSPPVLWYRSSAGIVYTSFNQEFCVLDSCLLPLISQIRICLRQAQAGADTKQQQTPRSNDPARVEVNEIFQRRGKSEAVQAPNKETCRCCGGS